MTYLTDWQFESPLPTVALFALAYAIGWRRRSNRRRAATDALLFTAGLGALVLAFASPLAALDRQLFWAHMTQHILLLAVAPPLILLSRPWATAWRALPLDVRRPTARGLTYSRWARPLREAGRWLASPPVALALFCGVILVWHVPLLFDATLGSGVVHIAEHTTFLAVGFLFWSQLIDSPPLHSRLGYPARALFALTAIGVGTALTLLLVLAPSPLYAGYADLASRPGGISALADQHLAAGIMWIPGSVPFAVALLVFAYRWLFDESGPRAAHLAAGR
ncbi:MAG: cytochrome c oxidase assembly protein [Thermoleophilia bacterium]|nr:cytochrome c oxidase assembly protein [Thermoleophilia bacterium]